MSTPGTLLRKTSDQRVNSYDKGLLTMIIMVSVGMAFALLQELVYFVHNRRVAQGKHKPKDGLEPFLYVY